MKVSKLPKFSKSFYYYGFSHFLLNHRRHEMNRRAVKITKKGTNKVELPMPLIKTRRDEKYLSTCLQTSSLLLTFASVAWFKAINLNNVFPQLIRLNFVDSRTMRQLKAPRYFCLKMQIFPLRNSFFVNLLIVYEIP